MSLVSAFVTLLAAAIGMLVAFLFIETVAAALYDNRKCLGTEQQRPRAGILIPAHNEAAVITGTLTALLRHLRDDDAVLVIADNCTDNTADLVRSFGVTVIERCDPNKRGKGYALAHGVSHWASRLPPVVVVIDADCEIEDGTLDNLVWAAWTTGRPAQAMYLLRSPENPSPRDEISAYAFLFKNKIRPLGLQAMKQPCLLTGTGMAFPGAMLNSCNLATGNIVEDLQLGLDLAVSGSLPLYVPEARVWGQLPGQAATVVSQRTRWEHGHIQTLLNQTPRLIFEAIRQRRVALLALALEICVPPLSLLCTVWALTCVLASVVFLKTGDLQALGISGFSGLLLVVTVVVAWWNFGRSVLSVHTLCQVPLYVLMKLPIYVKFLTEPQKTWIRTQREPR